MTAGEPLGLLLSLTFTEAGNPGPGGVGSPMGLLLALTQSSGAPTPTPTPTQPTVTEGGGAGRAAWRDHYEPYYKKKKRELETLNEALLELRAKIAEQKIAERAAAERSQIQGWIEGLRSAEVFLANSAANDVMLKDIAHQIERVHEALQEIEDEEAIVFLLH